MLMFSITTDEEVQNAAIDVIIVDANLKHLLSLLLTQYLNYSTTNINPNKLTFIVGSNKYNNDFTFEEEFEKYTNSKLKYFDYFRVNETLVGSPDLMIRFAENLYMRNIILDRNYKNLIQKTKDQHLTTYQDFRMALIEKLI